jgi:RimJ/RimL family protein N-acetyltransferase
MVRRVTTTVRLLDVGDWQLYRSLRLTALTDAPEAFGSTLDRETAFGEEVWRQRLAARNTFVAEIDGRPCGLVAVIPAGRDTAELVGMWVGPDAQGSGAGDLLVRAVLAWADERGLSEVRLWVAEGNHRAERLYARNGFRRTGATQPIRAGEDRREFAMARVTADVTAEH